MKWEHDPQRCQCYCYIDPKVEEEFGPCTTDHPPCGIKCTLLAMFAMILIFPLLVFGCLFD